MECCEKRVLTKSDLDGTELNFGDADKSILLTEKIALRQGIGDILAEGSARAAEHLGNNSKAFAMCCKGKEIPCHDPRNKAGLALVYGTGPIGPDYCVNEHDFDYSPVGFDYILDNSRAYGMLERTPETVLNPEKVRQAVYLHRWWGGALESLLFDLFSIAPVRGAVYASDTCGAVDMRNNRLGHVDT
jgi:aldehyde:ferredoxin oxidoreductase